MLQFQLTRSRGAWPTYRCLCTGERRFQLTRSRGAWLTACVTPTAWIYFNSHAHVERDNIRFKIKFSINRFQLTRSRGAWLQMVKRTQYVNKISTHTLTWSVTKNGTRKRKIFQISTHTLTWSVTRLFWFKVQFNAISTHTLTWSVTIWYFWISCQLHISTHTLTWSVTCIINETIRLVKFQLTRSRGAWPCRITSTYLY